MTTVHNQLSIHSQPQRQMPPIQNIPVIGLCFNQAGRQKANKLLEIEEHAMVNLFRLQDLTLLILEAAHMLAQIPVAEQTTKADQNRICVRRLHV